MNEPESHQGQDPGEVKQHIPEVPGLRAEDRFQAEKEPAEGGNRGESSSDLGVTGLTPNR
jgi:hypothetical protein